MSTAFPVFTIIPGKTRVCDAIAQARAAGVDIWLTPGGKTILAPIGRPGWRRLQIRNLETTPCAA